MPSFWRFPPPSCGSRATVPLRLIVVWAITAWLATGLVANAQDQTSPDPRAGATADPVEPQTFMDSVTVTATANPSPLRDTPGVVSVIDGETIQRRMIENAADLVKYEPGIYVENDVTRLGLNGFNIRGVGGNRVMTQIDGIQTSEQFDFGPFNVHQVGVDLDTLKSVEFVRSANSALYGSDALGGVVSLFTKDPADYLGTRALHIGGKTTWDGRSDDVSGNFTIAGGNDRLQGSFFASASVGNEFRNQGTVEALDDTRTAPNPQDRRYTQALGKLVFNVATGNRLRGSFEILDTEVGTAAYSQQGELQLGPIVTNILDVDAVDTQRRTRTAFDQQLVGKAGLDLLTWSAYGQWNDTAQVVDETRVLFGPPSARTGTLDYDQRGFGGNGQGQRWLGSPDRGALLTFGGSFKRDRFDILRDRTDTVIATGEPVPTRLIFPSKYFPKSDVTETGAYVQAELQFPGVTVVPGVRYDRFTLDADENDAVFLASMNPSPADFSAGAVSPKVGVAARVNDTFTVHGQYAGGFRAPPYSTVNTGFTNLAGGYTTLPNPDLSEETSDNFEVGLRGAFPRASVDVTGFINRYDNFINLSTVGFNPVTGLLEFQNENLSEVDISGVELRAEAYLTDNVQLRASFAAIDGTDLSDDEEAPLGTISPTEGVIGVAYQADSDRWGSELSVRIVDAQSQSDAEEGQYLPASYQVVDLLGYIAPTDDVRLRLGVLNLTDTMYFEWWNVRGRDADDPVIDRYSSPGISGVASLSYGW